MSYHAVLDLPPPGLHQWPEQTSLPTSTPAHGASLLVFALFVAMVTVLYSLFVWYTCRCFEESLSTLILLLLPPSLPPSSLPPSLLPPSPTATCFRVGLGGLCPKKALLCYGAMPAGSSIMLNPEAYYAWNMPTVCLLNFTTSRIAWQVTNHACTCVNEMATATSTAESSSTSTPQSPLF